MHHDRLARFQDFLRHQDIDIALIIDEDNVYYLCGYYDYLHREFGGHGAGGGWLGLGG